MLLLRLPGVYAPQEDTLLLLNTVLAEPLPPNARVCELGTGSGHIALELAAAGAGEVVAVDIARRAILGTRINAMLRRLPVQARRGDLLSGVAGLFDLIVANPPYVPTCDGPPPAHSRARAWDAGRDGRALLDRICRDAPGRLAPGGSVWLVHSALCDPGRTVALLSEQGLTAEVVKKDEIPFGPVMRSREAWLRAEGLIGPGENTETLVVVRGTRA
ncbi:methyltransferase [Sporichthya brevicatena]|uniref:Methyltransferase n=1 Tax=Sporichthya brevicatena TaxID=171442 RepID=A0ABN1HAJ3_9ACTN